MKLTASIWKSKNAIDR